MGIRILNASEVDHFRVGINNDPEFKIIGRYMSMNLVMEIEAHKLLFSVRDGEIKEIRPVLPMIDSVDVYIKGRTKFWEEVMNSLRRIS